MEEKDAMVDDARLRHDIKSSVTSIKAYTELLLRKTNKSLDSNTFSYILHLNEQVDQLIQYLAVWETHFLKRKATKRTS